LGPSKILKTWPPGIHTSTFQGNPLSCAMASATIDEILRSKLINRAKKINQILWDSLSKLNNLPSIFEVRTHGAGVGIEFIHPDGSANSEIVKLIEKQMLKKNIIVYAGGERNNVLMLIPPLIIKFNNLKNSLKVLVEEIYLLKKRKIIV
jgi:4-aminobutyrate aminotransferase-like enzyme